MLRLEITSWQNILAYSDWENDFDLNDLVFETHRGSVAGSDDPNFSTNDILENCRYLFDLSTPNEIKSYHSDSGDAESLSAYSLENNEKRFPAELFPKLTCMKLPWSISTANHS